MRPFSIGLLVFAALAFVAGVKLSDGFTLGLAAASAISAVLMLLGPKLSAFFRILNGLFVFETIGLGLVNLANASGLWPEDYTYLVTPRYLPLATTLFIVALYLISRFAFMKRMMSIADLFFEAATPLGFHIRPFAPYAMLTKHYAALCVVALVLLNKLQVALVVRLNYFYNAFNEAIQTPDEKHQIDFWYQILDVFVPVVAVIIISNVVEYLIASNFVLQWRRWMTASYTARWLIHSMHYRMALSSSSADNPDQRISQDVGAFINGTSTGTVSGRDASAGFYNYTIDAISSATKLVSFSIILWTISRSMKMTLAGVDIPGLLFWVAILYACLATGLMHLIGRSLAALFFKQQTVEANFRFGLARIREYGEQIALLKGEDREAERAANVFSDVFLTIKRTIRIRMWLRAFREFYLNISGILPYVIVAPFYFTKQVTFGIFNQAADAFGNVNTAMNFFVDSYIGFADFRSTVDRLTSFDDAFARVEAQRAQGRGVAVSTSPDANLSTPGLELELPDGRKLAQFGGLVLAPQEPTLVVGTSGAGKSTLFRAIAGLWPYGSGEIHQPAHATLMLLPQRPYIPLGPLRDAIAYPAAGDSVADDVLAATLTKVGLPALASRLNDSDNWQMRLSGGEQQRLAVARALLAKPDWLFLDESTASLDEQSEADLYRAIATALPGTTIVSIGHRSTLAAFHKRRIELQAHVGGPATLAG